MADHSESRTTADDRTGTPVPTRRSSRESSRSTSPRHPLSLIRRPLVPLRNALLRRDAARRAGSRSASLRSGAIFAMVAGLIATVALPAYAAWHPEFGTVTVQQVAAENAQSLVVGSDVAAAGFQRSSYSATTPEEVEKKKAEAAAAARAAGSGGGSFASASIDLSMVAPGSGQVRWPVDMSGITVGRGFGADGYHQGIDLLGPAGTPEFAAAAGTVRVAGWYYGYGNAVVIDHVINGVAVSTLYGHMTQTLVSPGQYVSAGQIIGLMGSTGSSTANHLHFEVAINGQNVDPYAWLQANAG